MHYFWWNKRHLKFRPLTMRFQPIFLHGWKDFGLLYKIYFIKKSVARMCVHAICAWTWRSKICSLDIYADFLFFGAFFLYSKYQSETHRKFVHTQWHGLMKVLCSISVYPICFSENLAQGLSLEWFVLFLLSKVCKVSSIYHLFDFVDA